MTSILIVPDLFYVMQHFKSIASQDYDHIIYDSGFTFDALSKRMSSDGIVSVDIETTSIDPSRGKLLLSTWHFPKSDYIVTIVHNFDEIEVILNMADLKEGFSKCIMISHNAGFEYRWLSYYGLPRPREIWCTMVGDQKVTQGMAGFRYNIVDTLNRRGIRHRIVKDVREDFAQITKYTDIELEHLLYNRNDTLPLYQLYNIQQFLMRSLDQEFWIKRIHMPLVMILVDMEVEGLTLNTVKWLKLVEEAEAELIDLDKKLHAWIRIWYSKPLEHLVPMAIDQMFKYTTTRDRLKDRIKKNSERITVWNKQGKTHLKAYSTTVNVLERAISQYKFLEVPDAKVNWNSTDQVLGLMKAIGFKPIPKGKSSTTHKYQNSLSKAARQSWLINNPGHPMKDLVIMLDKYMKQAKHLNSFGRGFIDKYLRPETGKVHTSYKQGTVATGRLASGNAHADPATFNSQQLPARQVLRECFGTDPGYLIATADLSGAELITMCSLAQDHRLLELSEDDMHSFFANKGWKAIYKSRHWKWKEEDWISKYQNKDKRTKYKNMTFGTIYGLKPNKAGETLNCASFEGKIAIDTIISEIPDTIKMVEQASAEALIQGWVLHNKRTNSRRWFRPVLDLMMENRNYPPENQKELENGYSKTIAQAARNTKIQGTQADMLCEAMVLLDRFIRFYKLDAKILLQVHDEIVVKFHKSYKDWFPGRLTDIMTRTANKYLDNVTMKADCQVELTWTK